MLVVVQALFTAVLARCIYRRYFHPLATYPGPFLASFTSLWCVISDIIPVEKWGLIRGFQF